MKKNIVSIIIGPDCDMEAIAIRSALEYFGFVVLIRPIGRPNDFIKILSGDTLTLNSDYLIFCFHGKNQKFILPKLSSKIYEKNEPRKNFSATEISKYARFNKQHIIATGSIVS